MLAESSFSSSWRLRSSSETRGNLFNVKLRFMTELSFYLVPSRLNETLLANYAICCSLPNSWPVSTAFLVIVVWRSTSECFFIGVSKIGSVLSSVLPLILRLIWIRRSLNRWKGTLCFWGSWGGWRGFCSDRLCFCGSRTCWVGWWMSSFCCVGSSVGGLWFGICWYLWWWTRIRREPNRQSLKIINSKIRQFIRSRFRKF